MARRLWHEVELQPAFYDVDPMAVVWHGNYVKYLEVARSALMNELGYDYEQMAASGYAWPIVDLRLKFVRPALLKQRLTVRAEVVEWENRLKVNYLLRDVATGSKVTTGYTIQVAVDAKTGEMLYLCPRALWDALGVEVPAP
jgi:acyl-CoA thioester hydrolase